MKLYVENSKKNLLFYQNISVMYACDVATTRDMPLSILLNLFYWFGLV